ncbi:hypothetical protein [Paraburkholderia sp.]|uniref:hypothetical protein n=1 Tax=Paraburkholderia sp. TaxID=1926495 RepID=UPI003C7CC59E
MAIRVMPRDHRKGFYSTGNQSARHADKKMPGRARAKIRALDTRNLYGGIRDERGMAVVVESWTSLARPSFLPSAFGLLYRGMSDRQPVGPPLGNKPDRVAEQT